VAKISGATVWWINPVTYELRASRILSADIPAGRSYASEAEHSVPVGVVHKLIVLDDEPPDAAVERMAKIAAELKARRPRWLRSRMCNTRRSRLFRRSVSGHEGELFPGTTCPTCGQAVGFATCAS
jgi:hypothetical protein